tara:strand:+ start:275 stop:1024 length:750 start_codon:yes stop_codon:yes gene_type:complete
MSDPMLVNRVRHPLRPIAPGAAVNPYLLHTDLSLNPFNLFRKSRRQAAQSSRDPLEQEKIAKETEERALTLEKDIKTLTEKLIEKIDRYNKVKDDFGEDVEYLNAIIDSAINRAGNFYRKGNDKDAKNKKRESNLQELKQRLPDMPKNLPALSESHIVSFKGELDKVVEEEKEDGLFSLPLSPVTDGDSDSEWEVERANHRRYDLGRHNDGLSSDGIEEDYDKLSSEGSQDSDHSDELSDKARSDCGSS